MGIFEIPYSDLKEMKELERIPFGYEPGTTILFIRSNKLHIGKIIRKKIVSNEDYVNFIRWVYVPCYDVKEYMLRQFSKPTELYLITVREAEIFTERHKTGFITYETRKT